MKIEVFTSPGCTSARQLRENIAAALETAGAEADVIFREVEEDEALRLQLKGSPTVRVDGRDIAEGGQPGIG